MKIALIISIIILSISTGLAVYITSFTPRLPRGAEVFIGRVLKAGPGNLIKGRTGTAKSGKINIWHEVIAPQREKKGTVLLIMGIANDALAWPDFFVQPLIEAGYEIIRYDQRGTGLSDWMANWNADKPYSLSDMAEDAVAILDHLHLKKVHVLGISMGGMVAQTFAIEHPDRTISLTSVMSSGYIMDPDLPGMPQGLVRDLLVLNLKYGIFQNETNMIKMHLAVRKLLKGGDLSEESMRHIARYVLYNMRFRNGYNSQAPRQHIAATYVSGSRYENLKKLAVPTLIIHGKADPFIPFAHGRKCAQLIPDAKTLWIEDMGHDLPEKSIDTLISVVTEHFRLTDNHELTASNH